MEYVNKFISTASVNYVNQALTELRDIDGNLSIADNLGNGIIIIQPTMDREEFNRRLVRLRPIFVRHINAVDFVVPVKADSEPESIAGYISEYGDKLQKGERLAVQIRKGKGDYQYGPIEYKKAIDSVLIEKYGVLPEIKDPERIISVFLNGESCYIGLSKAEDNLSNWSGGMMHYKKDDSDISRAKFKLMEAISVFDIDMSKLKSALDLGAAPGGWTSVLLEYGLWVTAVDTGDMDSRLDSYKHYEFLKTNVADLELDKGDYDILTSDISWNPVNTARMLCKSAQYLKQHGNAVVTVKLMSSKVRKTIRDVMAIYGEVFDILGARQLFHNRDEITLYMKKR